MSKAKKKKKKKKGKAKGRTAKKVRKRGEAKLLTRADCPPCPPAEPQVCPEQAYEERRRTGNWRMREVDPCYELAQTMTGMRCRLDSAKRMLQRGDIDGARSALVTLDQSARDIIAIFPQGRKTAAAVHDVTDEVIRKWLKVSEIGNQERRDVLAALQRIHPQLATLSEAGYEFCSVPKG